MTKGRRRAGGGEASCVCGVRRRASASGAGQWGVVTAVLIPSIPTVAVVMAAAC